MVQVCIIDEWFYGTVPPGDIFLNQLASRLAIEMASQDF